jgi:hypothetical protein
VPNSHAVAGREDYAPHYLGLAGGIDGRDEYRHIHNMIVLSSNISNREKSDYETSGAYHTIGNTRIEISNGDYFDGCVIIPGWTAPGTYFSKGHDSFQYIKRLENIVSGGIPNISIKNIDFLPNLPGGDRLQLRWQGGVQGPCDYVALLKVDRGDIPTESDIVGLQFGYVVKGEFYPDTQENGYFLTNRNPYNVLGRDDGSDYWVAYVDGFSRIINKVKWNRDTNKSNIINTKSLEIEEEEQIGNYITIYPTPADEIIYVEAREITLSASYQIFNIYGLKIADGKLSNNEMIVSKLPPGIYILKFETEQGAISKRFIKK